MLATIQLNDYKYRFTKHGLRCGSGRKPWFDLGRVLNPLLACSLHRCTLGNWGYAPYIQKHGEFIISGNTYIAHQVRAPGFGIISLIIVPYAKLLVVGSTYRSSECKYGLLDFGGQLKDSTDGEVITGIAELILNETMGSSTMSKLNNIMRKQLK